MIDKKDWKNDDFMNRKQTLSDKVMCNDADDVMNCDHISYFNKAVNLKRLCERSLSYSNSIVTDESLSDMDSLESDVEEAASDDVLEG